jgi:signal transduction histidine kinase
MEQGRTSWVRERAWNLLQRGAEHLDRGARRNVVAVNVMCVICACLAAVYALGLTLGGAASVGQFFLVIALGFVVSYLLNSHGHHALARALTLVHSSVCMWYLVELTGLATGFQNAVFLIAVLPLFFCSLQERLLIVFGIAVALVAWLACVLLCPPGVGPAIPESASRVLGVVLTPTLLAIIVAVAASFKLASERAEDALAVQVSDAERANTTLWQRTEQLHDAMTALRASEDTNRTLARRAGRAEVASAVLHNIGNVLNSVNVSMGVLSSNLAASKLPQLGSAVAELVSRGESPERDREREAALGRYLKLVIEQMSSERETMRREQARSSELVAHIGTILTRQEENARCAGLVVTSSIDGLVDDAVALLQGSFLHHAIAVERSGSGCREVQVDRHRLLQIVVNLLTNARDALRDCKAARITIATGMDAAGERFFIEVRDNGAGIAPENLGHIFRHGFTTKEHGHGFGLHDSCNLAIAMGGTLEVTSEGPGKGAQFRLELPQSPIERELAPSVLSGSRSTARSTSRGAPLATRT